MSRYVKLHRGDSVKVTKPGSRLRGKTGTVSDQNDKGRFCVFMDDSPTYANVLHFDRWELRKLPGRKS
jgi:hypothetical protein